ncbi:MAG: hypothetical protein HN392_00465 [Anaerolineae bacterium]|nr:hypothetical protein [Anaerolineae bacterium]
MKKNKTVKIEAGQEINVSLTVEKNGIRLSIQRVGVDAEPNTLVVNGTESGFDIKSNFSEDLSSDEEKAITDAITEIFEDLGLSTEAM